MVVDQVFVGAKPVMVYVMTLASVEGNEAQLLSRGRNMSKALDVLEVFKSKIKTSAVAEFETGTVVIDGTEGKPRRVTELIITIKWT